MFFCDPGGTQTHNLLIRSQMLYSIKLRDLVSLIRSHPPVGGQLSTGPVEGANL